MHNYNDIKNGQVFVIVGVSSLTVPEEQDGTSEKNMYIIENFKLFFLTQKR